MIEMPRGTPDIALRAFWCRGLIVLLLLGLLGAEFIFGSAPPGSWLGQGLLPGVAEAREAAEVTKLAGERGPYLWIKTVQGEFQDVVDAVISAASIKNFPVNGGRNYKESYTRRLQQLGAG